jgi:hypothetical protein
MMSEAHVNAFGGLGDVCGSQAGPTSKVLNSPGLSTVGRDIEDAPLFT